MTMKKSPKAKHHGKKVKAPRKLGSVRTLSAPVDNRS